MSLVKERYKAKERTRGMPFNGNNSGLDLSKLVTRGWCWVWFSFKPLPQSEGSTAQRLTLLLQVFELEKRGIGVLIGNKCQGRWAWQGIGWVLLHPETLPEINVCVSLLDTPL